MAGSTVIRAVHDSNNNKIDHRRFDRGKKYQLFVAVQGGGFLNIGGFQPIQIHVAIFADQSGSGTAIVYGSTTTNFAGSSDLWLTMPNEDISGYLVAWQTNGIKSPYEPCTIGSGTPPPQNIPDFQGGLLDQFSDIMKTITESAGKTMDQGINSTRILTQAITYGIIAIIAIVIIALLFYALQPRKQQQAAGAAKIILDTEAAQQLVKAGKTAATKGAA